MKCNYFHYYSINPLFFSNMFTNNNIYCIYKIKLFKFAKQQHKRLIIQNINQILLILN